MEIFQFVSRPKKPIRIGTTEERKTVNKSNKFPKSENWNPIFLRCAQQEVN